MVHTVHILLSLCQSWSGRKFSKILQTRAQNSFFFGGGGQRGFNVKFLFSNPEKHTLAQNHVVWRIVRENRLGGLGCGALEEPKKEVKWCAISRIRGKETPWVIVTKFCIWVDIQDVIAYATFSDDRLREFGVAMGRISHFPHWLASSPLHALLYFTKLVVKKTEREKKKT